MKNFILNSKRIYAIIVFFSLSVFSFGQTTLSLQDIAIIGVNTDNEDFTFLLRRDITAGTEIYFSDNEVNVAGTGLNDIGEGVVLFTAATNYSCGTVIGFIANSTEFTSIVPNFILGNSGDQVLAFQGYNSVTFEWTTFLHANVDLAGINLPVGVAATDILVGFSDNREYIGSTANPSWTDLNTNSALFYTWTNNASGWTLSTAPFDCYPCLSTVTWDGANWTPATGPDATTEVVLNGNYNTGINGSFSACSINVNLGFTLTVDNSTFVEVMNDVTGDGDVFVDTEGSLVQVNTDGDFNLNGTASMNKITAIKQDWYYYTYWSSPVVGETVADAFPNTPTNRRFLFNASQYLDADADDIDDNDDDWQIVVGGDILTSGVGYAATSSNLGLYPSTDIATFTGNFNNGNVSVPMFYNATNLNSWNFIGNPYPSALDFEAFYNANSSVLGGAAYFWTQSLPPDSANPGNEVENFNQSDYAIYTAGSGGTAAANGNVPDQYIPSAQGFFVPAIANGNVMFSNSMRDIGNNNDFYRLFPIANQKNRLWVNLTSDNGIFNQVLVAYVNGATNGYDGMKYDAPRNLSSGNAAIIYSIIENDTRKFAIQGKAPESLSGNEVIYLGFKNTVVVEDTQFTLSVANIEGDFMLKTKIYLVDNLLNKMHNLTQSDYVFTSQIGEFNDRFEIRFANTLLSVNNEQLNPNELVVANSEIGWDIYTSQKSDISQVAVFDLLGRQLINLDAKNKTLVKIKEFVSSSIYIVKVKLSNGHELTKKIVK